jgi:cyclohexadienyl dehydratase
MSVSTAAARRRPKVPASAFLLAAALLAPLAVASAAAPLRVASSGDYAPFSYEEEDGKLHGLDVEIAERLARDLGRELRLVRFAWPELEEKLGRGDFDVAISGVTMRPDRARAGWYARPYAVTGAVALLRFDASIRSLDDLQRPALRLAVNAGGHLERTAREAFPQAQIDPTTDNASLAERVRDGRADAAITDSAEVRRWLGRDLRAVGPITHDHKAFLLPASQAQLAARVDAWLLERERDGWLAARRLRWLGEPAALDGDAMTREAVAALVELRLGLMPAVAAAKRAAALPIEDAAQEERVVQRARAAAGDFADRAEAVYRVLIEMAKEVQRRAPATAAPPALEPLRAAIIRVDAQLARELQRLPPAAPGAWQSVLGRNLGPLGIEAESVRRLAGLLAIAPESSSDREAAR